MERMRSAMRRCSGRSSVVGPDGLDAPLDRRRAEHPGVHRQVPPLGVAPQPDTAAGVLPRHVPEVVQRLLLGGHLRHTGQLKVLLPPGQGVVRAPEGEIHQSVPGLDGQRRELLPPPHVQVVHEAVEPHLPEAAGGGHLFQHLRNGRGHQHPHVNGLPLREAGEEGLRRLRQGHALPLPGGGDDPLKVHKGQLRQNQVVHLVKGGLGQGQIPPPVQIVHQVRHGAPPRSCCFPYYIPVFSVLQEGSGGNRLIQPQHFRRNGLVRGPGPTEKVPASLLPGAFPIPSRKAPISQQEPALLCGARSPLWGPQPSAGYSPVTPPPPPRLEIFLTPGNLFSFSGGL